MTAAAIEAVELDCIRMLEGLQEEFTLDTPVNKLNREALHELLNLKGEKLDTLKQTYANIEKAIRKIVQKNRRCRSVEVHSHKARPVLSEFRTFKLPEILEEIKECTSSGANPFIWQLCVEKIYLKLLLSMHQSPPEESEPRHCLGDIELNGIRYAAGFIVRKLKKKYQKLKGHGNFVDCLTRMITDDSDIVADCEGSTVSLQEYTKAWISRTDRGGLSHVSNLTFWFFCEIESLVYVRVRKCYAGVKQPVPAITAWAVQDEDIQYIWSMIAFNIPDAEMSEQLLSVIVQEWTLLRGHTYRKTVLENHKKGKDVAEGRRSLRKELQRSHELQQSHNQTTSNNTYCQDQNQVTTQEPVTTEDQVTTQELEEWVTAEDLEAENWLATENRVTTEH